MIEKMYAEYAWEKAAALLAIDSPSGYTAKAAAWTKQAFEDLGYTAVMTNKGGVLVDLGGEDVNDGLMLQAHVDTLGCMVAEIKGNGRLRVTNLGGQNANNSQCENVWVYTRDGKVIDGTMQLCNASLHVNPEFHTVKRDWNSLEVVLDEDVRSAADTRKLGVEVGDIVCLDTRTRRTESGYLKSRYLDDKLCVGILLGFAKYMKDNGIVPARKTWAHLTVYEEVGHGGSGSNPDGLTEVLAIDMGCVGDGLQCTEKTVSFCAKDTHGPYSYDMITKLIAAAKKNGADYVVDVYPFYGSDSEATLTAGFDVRHGVMGPGVYASHGYERSHIDGVYNTLKVLAGYLDV